MKKTLPLLSLALVLVLFACKKSSKSEAQPEEKLYPVTFSASEFEQTTKGISTVSADSAKSYLKNLHYVVFNSSGTFVRSMQQDSALANFGTIRDSLPAGTYKILVSGSPVRYGLSLNSGTYSQGFFNRANGDYFSKEIPLTVSGPVSQNITLDRITGKLTVQFKDAIPSNVTRLVFRLVDDRLADFDQTFFGSVEERSSDIKSSDRLTSNYTYSTFILYTGNAFSLNIRAYNSSNSLVVDKTVNNVTVTKNKETIVTGKLFDTINHDGGFTIFVNKDLEPIPTVIEF
ncbi:hypothetical protein [Desertivirga arenae]|uniref:hypothetical protein n=1 Tax=Desertivirga arenae TaxID=2810309 RepID=UPI001A95E22D|nr:hypothetical protein [Pedobacter sp. SYSU D00823]